MSAGDLKTVVDFAIATEPEDNLLDVNGIPEFDRAVGREIGHSEPLYFGCLNYTTVAG